MNWLYIGLPLGVAYLIWFVFLLRKRRYTRALLIFAIAQLPYLLLNIVAPFRGSMDPNYAGYSFGLLNIPQGPMVSIIVGGMVIIALFLMSKALLNEMDRWWELAFLFSLCLTVVIAVPVLLSILANPASFRLELGEYLQVSGYWVAFLFFLILPLPTIYAMLIALKNVLKKRKLIRA